MKKNKYLPIHMAGTHLYASGGYMKEEDLKKSIIVISVMHKIVNVFMVSVIFVTLNNMMI